jgi:hypothetical protein
MVLSGALGALMILLARDHLPAAPALCSIGGVNPYVRSDRETYLIGVASSDSHRVRISDRPSLLEQSRRYPYTDSTPVFGRVVRVRSANGADADRVLARFAGGDSTVVVIRYSYDAMCRTYPTGAFLDTGVANHYTVFLRPDSEWARGRPTFDIKLLSWFAVYPHDLKGSRRDVNLDTMLTVEEYASLVKVLPTQAEWIRDCKDERSRAIAPLQEWGRRHPRIARAYPANDALQTIPSWRCPVNRPG